MSIRRNKLDLDGSGALDLPELVSFLEKSDSLMHCAGNAPLFLREADTDGDGMVSISEWLALWSRNKAVIGVKETKKQYALFKEAAELAKREGSVSASADSNDELAPVTEEPEQ